MPTYIFGVQICACMRSQIQYSQQQQQQPKCSHVNTRNLQTIKICKNRSLLLYELRINIIANNSYLKPSIMA